MVVMPTGPRTGLTVGWWGLPGVRTRFLPCGGTWVVGGG